VTPPIEPADKDAVMAALMARIETLVAHNAMLVARVAELEAKLGLPPKTPDNSSVPPSRGQKPSGSSLPKPKRKAHAGTHRPLHPNPTSRRDVLATACQHCRADVSGTPQAPVHAYDRIEIPEIKPDVTRMTLFGVTCPCCRKAFKAEAPAFVPESFDAPRVTGRMSPGHSRRSPRRGSTQLPKHGHPGRLRSRETHHEAEHRRRALFARPLQQADPARSSFWKAGFQPKPPM